MKKKIVQKSNEHFSFMKSFVAFMGIICVPMRIEGMPACLPASARAPARAYVYVCVCVWVGVGWCGWLFVSLGRQKMMK